MHGVLSRMVKRWVEMLGYPWVRVALQLLCVSKHGLCVNELVDILATLGFDHERTAQQCAFFIVFSKEGQQPHTTFGAVNGNGRNASTTTRAMRFCIYSSAPCNKAASV